MRLRRVVIFSRVSRAPSLGRGAAAAIDAALGSPAPRGAAAGAGAGGGSGQRRRRRRGAGGSRSSTSAWRRRHRGPSRYAAAQLTFRSAAVRCAAGVVLGPGIAGPRAGMRRAAARLRSRARPPTAAARQRSRAPPAAGAAGAGTLRLRAGGRGLVDLGEQCGSTLTTSPSFGGAPHEDDPAVSSDLVGLPASPASRGGDGVAPSPGRTEDAMMTPSKATSVPARNETSAQARRTPGHPGQALLQPGHLGGGRTCKFFLELLEKTLFRTEHQVRRCERHQP